MSHYIYKSVRETQATMVDVLRIVGSVLLFCLVFGMSATVDVHSLQAQLHNCKAIGSGLVLQFLFLPAVGYLTVRCFDLDHATGIILLVVTCSPGGSYSNWWCSLMNADLALSVTMTAISTCLSVVLLPLNLILYARLAFGEDLAETFHWGSLVTALLLVMSAVAAGLYASKRQNSHRFNLNCNRVGNYAGLVLILFSAVLSSADADARLWRRYPSFYFGVPTPIVAALAAGNALPLLLKLPHPEVLTVAVESCHQNVGIALSIALAMFDGEELARAVAVPFYYGSVQAIISFVYCLAAWKAGWTKAPVDVRFWTMISTSYEILMIEKEEAEAAAAATAATSGENKVTDDDGFCYVEHEEAAAAVVQESNDKTKNHHEMA